MSRRSKRKALNEKHFVNVYSRGQRYGLGTSSVASGNGFESVDVSDPDGQAGGSPDQAVMVKPELVKWGDVKRGDVIQRLEDFNTFGSSPRFLVVRERVNLFRSVPALWRMTSLDGSDARHVARAVCVVLAEGVGEPFNVQMKKNDLVFRYSGINYARRMMLIAEL